MRKAIWAILFLILTIGGVYAALVLSGTTVYRVVEGSIEWTTPPPSDLGDFQKGESKTFPITFRNNGNLPLTITCSFTGSGASHATFELACPATLAVGASFSTNVIVTIPLTEIATTYDLTVNIQGSLS